MVLCYPDHPEYLPEYKENPIAIVEIMLIGCALSADAMSVSLCNLLANPRMTKLQALSMPLLFGLFQGIMPLGGFYAGSIAAQAIEAYAGIITLIILGVIGGKMVWDGFHEDTAAAEDAVRGRLGWSVLLLQAVATSIDAFAVGVSLAAIGNGIWMDSAIIAACTFILCLAVVVVGRRFGEKLGARAQIAGGLILIAIGIKAFLF
jgi:putative Mn2+ efflux pump MntP